MVNKDQQEATRELHAALIKYLLAFNWRPVDHKFSVWTHPKLFDHGCRYRSVEALNATHAEPTLGWR